MRIQGLFDPVLIWLGGFERPVLEVSALFWLIMIAFGLYFGLRFEDVKPEEQADNAPADGDKMTEEGC